MKDPKQLTWGSLLIPLGIIFGDIGTSPLYVVDQFTFRERMVLQFYYLLKRLGITEEKAYGLDTNLSTLEKVPLILRPVTKINLTRI